jgi:hypothetical protein
MSIHFDESTHTYTRNNNEYTSVTTLIKKYTPVFESDYWSTYKAVKDVLSSYWEWSEYKGNAGGWEGVVDFFKRNGAGAYEEEIKERKQYYLDLWEELSQEALDKGTIVHERLEREILSGERKIYGNDSVLQPNQMGILNLQQFTGDGVFPELKVFNDRYKVAGMVDLVRKIGRTIHITDYKTCKEIAIESFRDEKLLPPLQLVPNSDFYKYQLQVSLYAWMLEQCGFDIGELTMEHRDKNTAELICSYALEYKRNDIIKLLEHHEQN